MGINNKIVYVDDESDLLDIFKILNSDLPVDLVTFDKPKEALEYFNSQSDLSQFIVISDVTMPEVNGADLYRNLKAKIAAFYFVTADPNSAPSDINADGVLTKPIEQSTVKNLVDKHFK